MRKINLLGVLMLFLSLCTVINVQAQNADNPWSVSFSGGLNEYKGILGDELFSLDSDAPAFRFGVHKYLNPSLDAELGFSFGGLDFGNFEEITLDADLNLQYKFNNGYILNEDAIIKPFLNAGIGVFNAEQSDSGDSEVHLMTPLGGGLRIKLVPGLDARLMSVYKYSFNDDYSYLQHTIGLVISLGDNWETKPTPPPVVVEPEPVDSDGDGIADAEDQCPQEPGSVANQGCPDTDGDGIIDKNDDCPKVPGLESLNGCPDSDGDGIADKDDACPNVTGGKATSGCPDRDGDGIIDKEDVCPDVPGIAKNKGCPEIDKEVQDVLDLALEGINFRSGSDIITTSSYSILNKIVTIMDEHPEFNLTMSGYTDSQGGDDLNLDLSKRRAAAARQYLIDKGVGASRLSSEGYGEASPIADNGTSAGRAQNRRVEFEIVF